MGDSPELPQRREATPHRLCRAARLLPVIQAQGHTGHPAVGPEWFELPRADNHRCAASVSIGSPYPAGREGPWAGGSDRREHPLNVLEEYRRDGRAAIERLRFKDPRAYLMLTACLLPQYAEEIQRALDGTRVREIQ